ncbi:MAG: methyltransferase domain-containing protein [Pseudomonadota bacterium]
MTGYALSMSADETRRLRIQGDMVRADAERMLREVGLAADARCLDLCCGVGGITDLMAAYAPKGEVIGLDYDPVKLEAARDWAADLSLGITYVEGDGFDPPFSPDSFDLVHVRFALGIIADGAEMLVPAIDLLKPGGVLFVEEVIAEPYRYWPPDSALDEGTRLMVEAVRVMGSDAEFGRRLPGLFNAAGLDAVRIHPVVHLIPPGAPMIEHLPLTLLSLRGMIIEEDLCGEEEFDTLLARIGTEIASPDRHLLSFTLVQAVGRKPAI